MLIIGIAGGTGSGKTTFVNNINNHFSTDEICVISQDSYYNSTDHLTIEERSNLNFDHPDAIDFELLTNHLSDLKNQKAIEQPIYSFTNHNRTKETIHTKPQKVIIVEGILIFCNKKLRDLFDIKFYIETDTDERLIRRIKRDISERNRDINEVLNRYQNTLKPMHLKHIEPTKAFADIIVPNNKHNIKAINIIRTVLNNKLQ